ncbi:oligosaccharide flippase family protein [archaeon]|mgnify:CR=1 FL=1|jgi:O-antigen/teichoic acid export membrane protein|nr:oligosaccharide flippase family protein [archaeon]MBT6761826.1 oligosaccharide flippase family protein [archaeon]
MSQNQTQEKTSQKALQTVAKGAGFIFANMVLLYVVRFVYKIVISRYLSPSGLGLLSLGLMVLGVCTTLTLLGLNNGIVKFISHYNGLKDAKRLLGTVRASLGISLIASIFMSILVLFSSKFIANNLFHEPELQPIIIVFAFCIPILSQFKLFGKAFTGFKKPEVTIITGTIGREISLFVLVSIMIFLGGSILEIAYMYIFSILIGLALSVIIFQIKFAPFLSRSKKAIFENKELMLYSLPLFLSAAFVEVMGWADTFFLGIYLDTTSVGIYNVALALAASLNIFLKAFASMSFPVISELKAKQKTTEMIQLFGTVTRWGFILSFPFFLLVILFPGEIIGNVFGWDYSPGAIALIVLVSAYFANVISGPASEALKAFGEVTTIFWSSIVAAGLNIVLNILLIPRFGLTGAALATAITLAGREFYLLIIARKLIPFRYKVKYYFKYILSAIIPTTVIFFVVISRNQSINLIQLIVLTASYLFLYYLSVLFIGGIAKEDSDLIILIEKKAKINLEFIKKFSR